jgi:hypothetical protein
MCFGMRWCGIKGFCELLSRKKGDLERVTRWIRGERLYVYIGCLKAFYMCQCVYGKVCKCLKKKLVCYAGWCSMCFGVHVAAAD